MAASNEPSKGKVLEHQMLARIFKPAPPKPAAAAAKPAVAKEGSQRSVGKGSRGMPSMLPSQTSEIDRFRGLHTIRVFEGASTACCVPLAGARAALSSCVCAQSIDWS